MAITYDSNGADGNTETQKYTYGLNSMARIIDNNLIRAGYEFSEWNTEPDGSGTAYEPGAWVAMKTDLLLYAIRVASDAE